MTLPNPPQNPNTPIPNNPFSAPLNPFVCGPYFPVAVSAGIDMTTGATVPELINDVGNVLAAGPGIALNTFLGTTTITATGGGGGGIPCSTITGKGALVTGTAASTPVALAVGTDGYVLTACAACTEGLTWIASSGASPATPIVEGIVYGCTDGATSFNTALGYNALLAPTALGIANVAIGTSAGNAVTDGYGNTLIGPGTGCSVTTGTVNTAVGIGALCGVTSGFANLGVGICSGCAYITESGNAVFGGYYGDPGDTNSLILSDGAGNLKAKFDSLGALSFDGTAYGAIGEVLSSNGPGAAPTWITAGGASPATPDTFGTLVGLVDTSANAGLGCFVLYNLTTGTDNVAIGDNALGANTSGSYNVAVGTYASSFNTTGEYNTAVGHNVFNSNTTGSYNNAFGLGTLGANTTGCYNNAFGWGALGVSLTGDSNTAIGNKAMALNNTGSFNTGIGEYSLCSIDSGCYNVGVGHCSGRNISTGCYNVAIGPDVEFANGGSSCQLSIGFSATSNWLTGDSSKNIQPGAGIRDCANSLGTAGQALLSTGTAVCWGAAGGVSAATPTVEGIVFGCTDSVGLNYGLGDNILSAITTGSLNIAIGTGALATTDTGTSNTAVGIGALFGNTTGVQNVALGQQTLFTSTTAGLNTAVGSQALQNTTGDANTALGNFAGNVLTTGCGNILVGNQAGGAGAGALDTGSNNVVIGNCISPVSNSGNCQLAIGAGTICWLTGTSTGAIKPGAGIIDCAASTGTAGQVLMSNGSNAICWGAAGGASAATPTVAGTVLGCTVNSNAALGCNAFLSNTGSCITGIGCDALRCNTTGVANTALGYSALCLNTTALANTAVGGRALRQVTSGDYNSAHGAFTLQANITGTHNSAFGACALYTATGSCNAALGWLAGCQLTSGSNNVIIGPDVQAPSATDSCQLVIGFSATDNWLTGNSTKAIKPGAGILDAVNSSGTAGQVLASSGLNQIQWQTINTFKTTVVTGTLVGGTGSLSNSFGPSLNSWNYVGVVYVTLNVVDTVTSAVYNYLYNGMMYADGSTPWTMSELSAKTLDNSGGAFTVLLDFDTGYQYKARLTVTNNSANQLSVNGNVNWANLSGDFA